MSMVIQPLNCTNICDTSKTVGLAMQSNGILPNFWLTEMVSRSIVLPPLPKTWKKKLKSFYELLRPLMNNKMTNQNYKWIVRIFAVQSKLYDLHRSQMQSDQMSTNVWIKISRAMVINVHLFSIYIPICSLLNSARRYWSNRKL